jgi:hypothetical protein
MLSGACTRPQKTSFGNSGSNRHQRIHSQKRAGEIPSDAMEPTDSLYFCNKINDLWQGEEKCFDSSPINI